MTFMYVIQISYKHHHLKWQSWREERKAFSVYTRLRLFPGSRQRLRLGMVTHLKVVAALQHLSKGWPEETSPFLTSPLPVQDSTAAGQLQMIICYMCAVSTFQQVQYIICQRLLCAALPQLYFINDQVLVACWLSIWLPTGVIPSVSIEREAIDETTLTIFPAIDFGNPRASVSWLFDGEILDPTTNRITISDEGVLIVTNFAEGPYTVLVSNTYGAVNATIDIIIPRELTYFDIWTLILK